jgi:hypothetical protein
MPYQNIDATLSAADLQAIRDAFATIKQKLPFLVALTVDERKATFKAGPNSLAFVQNCLAAAKNFPQILPPSFDVGGFERDVNLFASLTELRYRIAKFANRRHASGSRRRSHAGSHPSVQIGASGCQDSARP